MFRIQDDDSIIYGFYCIDFMEYMIVRKALLDYANLLSPKDYKKNNKMIYKCFKDKHDKRKRTH